MQSTTRSPFYTALETVNGQWGFRTPTGKVDQIPSLERAELIAKMQEEQDRKEAASDSESPIAAVLRKHFAKNSDLILPIPEGGLNE